jgi:hypothetical protein
MQWWAPRARHEQARRAIDAPGGFRGFFASFMRKSRLPPSANHLAGTTVKKHLAAFAAAISLTCAGAYAQTAPAIDPAAAVAARELMDVLRTREMMTISMQQAEQQFPKQVEAMAGQALDTNPNITAEQKAEARARLEKTLPLMSAELHKVLSDPTLLDQMQAEILPLYAQTYTVDELHQLAAFYKSPLGQKTLASMPKLMAASMEINNRVMLPRLKQMMAAFMQQMAPAH